MHGSICQTQRIRHHGLGVNWVFGCWEPNVGQGKYNWLLLLQNPQHPVKMFAKSEICCKPNTVQCMAKRSGITWIGPILCGDVCTRNVTYMYAYTWTWLGKKKTPSSDDIFCDIFCITNLWVTCKYIWCNCEIKKEITRAAKPAWLAAFYDFKFL